MLTLYTVQVKELLCVHTY